MGCCARLAPALLLQVNLLLCVSGGACLATAARLKWDPSTYVVLRALFPAEYRAASGALAAAGGALLALAHLAAAALALRAPRPAAARAMLITYAVLQTALVLGAAAWAAWVARQLAAWLRSPHAELARELLELRDLLRPLFAFLAKYHPLPDHINDIIEEAQADAPWNGYVAAAAALLTALLQPAAALLALLSARAPRPPRAALRPPPNGDSVSYSLVSTDSEKSPLKTAFKNGRLVIL